LLEVAEKKEKPTPTPIASRRLPPHTVALTALSYFAASLALVPFSLFALDRWVIPGMENSGQLESFLWTDENHRLNHFTYLKNDARPNDPVWRSKYMPVAPEHSGKKRILVLGDSFVWGDGSESVNQLWWRQLQLELARRGYPKVEVIAAGLNGASTRDQKDWLSALIPKYKPDLIVLGYVTNDPEERRQDGSAYVPMMNKELPDEDPVLAKLGKVLPNLTGQLKQIRKLSRQAALARTTDKKEYADWEMAILEGDNFAQYKRTVGSLAETLKAHDTPAFVITLPAGFQNKTRENVTLSNNFFESVRTYNAERYAKVKPLFQDAGLLFVDTNDAFASAASSDPILKASSSALRLGINPGNGHPGTFSTHFYAASAADVIEKNFPQALGEKDAQAGSAEAQSVEMVEINDCVPPYMNVTKVAEETFQFTYPPDATDHTLFLPLRKRHVLLSFNAPARVSGVQLEGPDLAAAQIYLNKFDEKLGYAPPSLETLPLKKGSSLSWDIPSASVSSIKLRAAFQGNNQLLKLKLTSK
jgi:lysophospholipase L1-like esterase